MGILATPQAVTEQFQSEVYRGSGINAQPQPGVTAVAYGRDTNEKWIYCNYPEKLVWNGSAAPGFVESGHCINRQTVSGTTEFFFSHNTTGTQPYTYGVMCWNINEQPITVTKLNEGLENGWNAVNPWRQFFNSTPVSYNIGKGQGVWIMEHTVSGSAFHGMMRIQCDQPVEVTVYAFTGKTMSGGEPMTPYDPENCDCDEDSEEYGAFKQYSGLGEGFYNQLALTMKASEMPKYFWNNHPNTPNTNEIIPIHLADGTVAAAGRPSPRHNVGNWCAHYFNNITLQNDTAVTKTFRAFFGEPLNAGACGIIHSAAGTISMDGGAGSCWKWFEHTLAPGETYQFNYEYILGTNSSGPACFMWTVEDPDA